MSPSPNVPYIEIHVPNAKTEQEFLRLAVQAAVKKYRAICNHPTNPPPAIFAEEHALPQRVR